jgi:dimethylhistidine N-methyltransferase
MTQVHSISSQRAPSQRDDFLEAVLDGLSRPQKSLPSRYFYDARGSELFERITQLPEYYPTRVETELLAAHADSITRGLPSGSVLVEFGSGSSTKTELLLRAFPGDGIYAPIDVSPAALDDARQRLALHFPDLIVWPIMGDFFKLRRLPQALAGRSKLGFFPGSTIGNFTPADASRLLSVFRILLAPNGRLVIGVDLQKDAGVLERAYNDSAGITAEFNLNLIRRINREIAPILDVDAFEHMALYNGREGRIEMHLVSRRDQSFDIGGRRFFLARGETIHTENSYKYTVARFQAVARSAGWMSSQVWIDNDELFSIHELT